MLRLHFFGQACIQSLTIWTTVGGKKFSLILLKHCLSKDDSRKDFLYEISRSFFYINLIILKLMILDAIQVFNFSAIHLCKRIQQNKQRLELADYEAENYSRLQKKFSRQWEFVSMQADTQAKFAELSLLYITA